MGFFCYSCNKKVRGQPNNHGCTRKKYGNKANARIYDKLGNKGHRMDRRQMSKSDPGDPGFPGICLDHQERGYCAFGNKYGFRNVRIESNSESEFESEYDFNDRDLTRLEEWRAIVQQWDIETSIPCRPGDALLYKI